MYLKEKIGLYLPLRLVNVRWYRGVIDRLVKENGFRHGRDKKRRISSAV